MPIFKRKAGMPAVRSRFEAVQFKNDDLPWPPGIEADGEGFVVIDVVYKLRRPIRDGDWITIGDRGPLGPIINREAMASLYEEEAG